MLNQGRAELYLCLARAFLAPTTAQSFTALREHLAADLEDLAGLLGYPIAGALKAYREAISAVPDQERLLVTYSRLFLVPGTARPAINAGVYLDGGVNGGTVVALEGLYRRCGLARDHTRLHDLPDHVSVQLEFLAYLYAAAATRESADAVPDLPVSAEDFVDSYVGRWAPALHADLARVTGCLDLGANPYLPLAAILETAARADAAPLWQPARGPRPKAGPRTGQPDPVAAGLSEEDLAVIRARLRAHGLSTDHLGSPHEEEPSVAKVIGLG